MLALAQSRYALIEKHTFSQDMLCYDNDQPASLSAHGNNQDVAGEQLVLYLKNGSTKVIITTDDCA